MFCFAGFEVFTVVTMKNAVSWNVVPEGFIINPHGAISHKTAFFTVLPVVLYWCITWSLTWREEHWLRVFENRVLRRIFGWKGNEVAGGWRKLHTEEICNLYSLPSIIRTIVSRRMRGAGHAAGIWETRNSYTLLVGKSEGKTQLWRPRCRWVDNIKMDPREIRFWGYWLDLSGSG
jgi:hypothetical protein